MRSQKVRQLIGAAHWLSDGHHKEALVREFLRKYLPPNLSISRGFVVARPGELQSPEVDVLISNLAAYPPLFSEGELQIVTPSSVAGHLEIKSQFTGPNLQSALSAIATTQCVIDRLRDARDVWRGIFFFDVPETRTLATTLDTIVNSIEVVIKRVRSEFNPPRNIDDVLPLCISSMSNFVAFLIKGDQQDGVRIKIFELGELSAAAAFVDAFLSLRKVLGGNPGEVGDLINSLNYPPPLIRDITL